MTVAAIQGIRGSYSEEAAYRMLGDCAQILECVRFEDAFEAVLEGRAEVAVIPFRNRIVGDIELPNRLLSESGLKVLESRPLEIRHVLAGTKASEFETVATVRSHIEALRQCSRFFRENRQFAQIVGADTASSVKRIVRENEPQNAAICSARAAEIYGARILREEVADDRENWTTFCVIGN